MVLDCEPVKNAKRTVLVLCAAGLGALLPAAACGGKSTPPGLDPGGPAFDGAVADRAKGPTYPDASCLVTLDTPPMLDGIHVAIGTDVVYNSNPPASGPHYPIWAAFQEFQAPVDRRYYVHDLEHGAVVLLYNCGGDGGTGDGGDADLPDGGDAGDACNALVEGLRKAAAAIDNDPLCDQDAGVRARVVITPDPLLTTPIAATAWGNTYTAACVDIATLAAFAKSHYGHGTESTCANGISSF